MPVLSERLDKISNSLESKGLIKEAMAVDIIANTLEAFEKDAWNAQSSMQYKKYLEPALNAAKANNASAALMALKAGDQARTLLITSYPDNSDAKSFSDNWIQARTLLEQGNIAGATKSIENSIGFLRALEPVVNAAQHPNTPPQGQVPVNQVLPTPMVKRTPIPHPARAMR